MDNLPGPLGKLRVIFCNKGKKALFYYFDNPKLYNMKNNKWKKHDVYFLSIIFTNSFYIIYNLIRINSFSLAALTRGCIVKLILTLLFVNWDSLLWC